MPRQKRNRDADMADYLFRAMNALGGDLRDTPERDWPFCSEAFGRKWLFDIALPNHRLAIEVDGGRFVRRPDGSMGGRHIDPVRIADEAAKKTAAAMLGWRMMHIPADKVEGQIGQILDAIRWACGSALESKDRDGVVRMFADWSRLKGVSRYGKQLRTETV